MECCKRAGRDVAVVVCLLCVVWAVPVAAVTVITNGVYEVQVADTSDTASFGSWNAFTSAGHPTGAGNNLLFDEDGGITLQDTNFSTLRVYGSTVTDYSFAGSGDGSGVDFDPFVTLEGPSPFGPVGTGHRTRWALTPESLQITQDVVISGTTFASSAVYHTVLIQNTGSTDAKVGWRNLYDWQVDDPNNVATFDDGPSNRVEKSDTTPVLAQTATEFTHVPGADELVRVSFFPGTAAYESLLSLTFDPGFIGALPVTAPDEYAFVGWPIAAFDNPFDYTIGPFNVADPNHPDQIDDSAGLTWWGRDSARALDINAGGAVRLTQVIFGVVSGGTAPVIPLPSAAWMGLGLLGFGTVWRKVRRRRGER